ncbi:MAG: hypothetical protein OXI30_16665 [Chloroflexota bacterium]|nr:hypothetical protein [Chloroflexota bacterium]
MSSQYSNSQPQPRSISLLWLDAESSSAAKSSTLAAADDLRVKVIADAISPHIDYLRPIHNLLSTLLTDEATLRYRQDALEDCLANPSLSQGLRALLPQLRNLHNTVRDIRARRNQVSLVLSRLTELEDYIECVTALEALLRKHLTALKARGWRDLARELGRIVGEPAFVQMTEELPQLRAEIRQVVSVTIGVNLSPDLKPVAATLLSINKERFRGPRFFRKLWGIDDEADWRGISTLHESPDAQAYRNGSVLSERRDTLDRLAANALFSDLGVVLDDVIRPIARALERYTHIRSGLLRALEPEIAFYVGAAGLVSDLRDRGLPFCRPRLLAANERRLEARALYNLDLALRLARQQREGDLKAHIVGNDVSFGDKGRIHILTGPNRGGKTTYIQAIGLLHALAQSGMFVPAESAALSPVDGIYLHFPAEEKPNMESGRLGEEAGRLREIFSRATRHSLLLLNESLASTSATESYFLARDVVCCLRILGARALYVTHLHELAADCEAINSEVCGDSRVQSLISLVEAGEDGVRRTYQVVPAPPRGQSYAREIARQYGISFEQLQALIGDGRGRAEC